MSPVKTVSTMPITTTITNTNRQAKPKKSFNEIMNERNILSNSEEAPQPIMRTNASSIPMPSHSPKYQIKEEKLKPTTAHALMSYQAPKDPFIDNEYILRVKKGALLKTSSVPVATSPKEKSPLAAVHQYGTPSTFVSPHPMLVTPPRPIFTLNRNAISSPSTPQKDIRQETRPLLSVTSPIRMSPMPFPLITTPIPIPVFATPSPRKTQIPTHTPTRSATPDTPMKPSPALLFSDMAISPTKTTTPSATPKPMPNTPTTLRPKHLPAPPPITIVHPKTLSVPSNPGAVSKVVVPPKPIPFAKPTSLSGASNLGAASKVVAQPKPVMPAPALSIKEALKKPLILSTVQEVDAALAQQGMTRREIAEAVARERRKR